MSTQSNLDSIAPPPSPGWEKRAFVIDQAFKLFNLPSKQVAKSDFFFSPTTLTPRTFLDSIFLRRELISFSNSATKMTLIFNKVGMMEETSLLHILLFQKE